MRTNWRRKWEIYPIVAVTVSNIRYISDASSVEHFQKVELPSGGPSLPGSLLLGSPLPGPLFPGDFVVGHSVVVGAQLYPAMAIAKINAIVNDFIFSDSTISIWLSCWSVRVGFKIQTYNLLQRPTAFYTMSNLATNYWILNVIHLVGVQINFKDNSENKYPKFCLHFAWICLED